MIDEEKLSELRREWIKADDLQSETAFIKAWAREKAAIAPEEKK